MWPFGRNAQAVIRYKYTYLAILPIHKMKEIMWIKTFLLGQQSGEEPQGVAGMIPLQI